MTAFSKRNPAGKFTSETELHMFQVKNLAAAGAIKVDVSMGLKYAAGRPKLSPGRWHRRKESGGTSC